MNYQSGSYVTYSPITFLGRPWYSRLQDDVTVYAL